jgi:U-box domain
MAMSALLPCDLNNHHKTLSNICAYLRLPSCNGCRGVQTQEVTEDPVIAADSFTYERSAIASWLRNHDTSPMVRVGTVLEGTILL